LAVINQHYREQKPAADARALTRANKRKRTESDASKTAAADSSTDTSDGGAAAALPEIELLERSDEGGAVVEEDEHTFTEDDIDALVQELGDTYEAEAQGRRTRRRDTLGTRVTASVPGSAAPVGSILAPNAHVASRAIDFDALLRGIWLDAGIDVTHASLDPFTPVPAAGPAAPSIRLVPADAVAEEFDIDALIAEHVA
jgi:hypothetical protein